MGRFGADTPAAVVIQGRGGGKVPQDGSQADKTKERPLIEGPLLVEGTTGIEPA